MNSIRVAYFSMEIELHPAIPTYSGGLGVLAGDTIRSAADLKVPLCAVTLLHREGYFSQRIDETGWQQESAAQWSPEDHLEQLAIRTSVDIEGRTVWIRAWRYQVTGVSGFKAPVYLLDTDLPENSEFDRTLTNRLYGSDLYYRLCQELVLGVGGARILKEVGHDHLDRYHMNEGHAALLGVELLNESAKDAGRDHMTHDDVLAVREKCIFTTHTPVPAGHDRFPMDMVRRVLGEQRNFLGMQELFCPEDIGRVVDGHHLCFDREDLFTASNQLNMTYLALNLSHYVNGVAKRHAEVSRLMFADIEVDAITNGVHAATWVATPFQQLFDDRIPGWRSDNSILRNALKIDPDEVWRTHQSAKKNLIDVVNSTSPRVRFDTTTLTLGFARRATSYKRPELLLADFERIKALARTSGGLQIVYAGKAHPNDHEGKMSIQRIIRAAESLGDHIRLVYLENYDTELAKLLVSGVDVWLNTPLPPLEASGTSGMKAALNGVPSLSVLDGWWLEGCIEDVTGWSINTLDAAEPVEERTRQDNQSLLDKLTYVAIMFRDHRDQYINIMRHSIALNGAHFNTQRMMQQYVQRAYF